MSEDKIFNNTFGQQDISGEKISFTVSNQLNTELDHDEKIHYYFSRSAISLQHRTGSEQTSRFHDKGRSSGFG